MEGFKEFFWQHQKTPSQETFEEIKKFLENFENKIKSLSIKPTLKKIKSDLRYIKSFN
jgi:hypothetical protein